MILACTGEYASLLDVLVIVRAVINVIQWVVPVILILMGTIDLLQAVTKGKEDEIKKGTSTLIKRAITAVIVFLVPVIVNVIMGFIGTTDYRECWNAAGEKSIQDVIQ